MNAPELQNRLINLWQTSRIDRARQRDYSDLLHAAAGGRNDTAALLHLLVKETADLRDLLYETRRGA